MPGAGAQNPRLSVKLEQVVGKGPPTASKDRVSQCCNKCGIVAKDPIRMQLCSGCKAVFYCGTQCQRKDRKVHKSLCQAIKCLSGKEEVDIKNMCEYMSHLSPTQYKYVVGKRCVVDCAIEGVSGKALWDPERPIIGGPKTEKPQKIGMKSENRT